ncbi:MAG: asparagine--tRNA ligase [Sphaerochaetaceae bacterium]|nr:asparagine--tRNA ligase [Sphaerochaetaceae bacterium]MDD3162757.1 asparagine--tRNA ligase [Sphaerochaetaceae bacterium]MDD4006977.1 asparagine--tRNA ligase [Sphaerochaetaceae bacterium]MDD4396058.1 asparagine--tRNA ligase [Sphaerochaetaceae bacterium]
MEESIAKLMQRKAGPDTVVVKGWLRTKRDSKTISFLEVNDGSSLKGIQVVVDKGTFNNPGIIDQLSTGCSVVCTGKIVESMGGSQSVELAADSVEIVGECPSDTYPLQKKRHSLEYLREIAHLRPRTNTIGAVARVRNCMAYAVHTFFQQNGFYYVNTPLITASDCEGAGAMFQVTTLDLNKVPHTADGAVDYSKDFFGKRASLTVSGQLEGETYAMALKNIYTFGPTFRAENSVTKRHLAEFWMIEPEMAFCNLDGDRAVVESFLKFVFGAVLRDCPDDLEFFDKLVEPGLIAKLQHVVDTPFAHLEYTDAIAELEKAKVQFDFKPYWGCDLQTEHERYLSETVCHGPVAVTDYPKEIKSFYMKANEDGKTVAAMDVLVPRLGEIVGGSEREYRYDVLVDKMKALGMREEDYWWYLDLRRFGSVPHAGFGLGFERAVMYATGMQNIRDVIPYPRAVGSAEF